MSRKSALITVNAALAFYSAILIKQRLPALITFLIILAAFIVCNGAALAALWFRERRAHSQKPKPPTLP